MADSDYITAADLAREWGVSRQWIGKLIQDGRIKSKLRFGSRVILKTVKRPAARTSGPRPADS